jgi:GNAT superfamily N-acetyltransferase
MNIRKMQRADKSAVIDMMRTFYHSPAVSTNGSEEIYERNVENCLKENPYLEGYVFEVDGQPRGYSLIAKSYATEYGRQCVWIEDIYIQEACRGQGIAGALYRHAQGYAKDCGCSHITLNVWQGNENAMAFYEKMGMRPRSMMMEQSLEEEEC